MLEYIEQAKSWNSVNTNTSSMTNQFSVWYFIQHYKFLVQSPFQAKFKMGLNQNSYTSKTGQNNTRQKYVYKILKHEILWWSTQYEGWGRHFCVYLCTCSVCLSYQSVQGWAGASNRTAGWPRGPWQWKDHRPLYSGCPVQQQKHNVTMKMKYQYFGRSNTMMGY